MALLGTTLQERQPTHLIPSMQFPLQWRDTNTVVLFQGQLLADRLLQAWQR